MADHNEFSFDARVAGKDRLRIMLLAKGATLVDFAEKKGVCAERAGDAHHPSEVTMCLARTREYPEIRQDLADFLEIDRSAVDALIDGEREAAAEGVA